MQNSKKKILYVITKSNFGGAQRYVYDLATSLPQEQFGVTVVLGDEGTLKEKLDSAGIRTITLPYFKRDIHVWNDIKTFFALVGIFRKERPDIIHLNSSKAGILGALAARIANLSKVKGQRSKIVFTAHGWAFNEQRPWWQKFLFFVIHFKTILFSHTTIAVSQKTKNQIAWMPFIQKKIQVIYNGIKKVDLKTKEVSRVFFAEKNNILKEKENFLWIGTVAELHPTKGLTYAIHALHAVVADMPRVIYVIIGDGEERGNLQKIIHAENLQDNVFLMGFIENAAQYLTAFDIMLMPSLSEAFPYTPLEAGQAKLPIIASTVGGIPEIIEHNKSGILVAPKNKKEIARAVTSLIKNRELRLTLGETLFHVTEEKFSFDNMFKNTISLYK